MKRYDEREAVHASTKNVKLNSLGDLSPSIESTFGQSFAIMKKAYSCVLFMCVTSHSFHFMSVKGGRPRNDVQTNYPQHQPSLKSWFLMIENGTMMAKRLDGPPVLPN